MVVAIDGGSWAETEGLQLGDQLLAIGGVAVDRWAAAQPPSSGFTLMGPQRLVVQFQATPEDVKQALRSVSSSAEQRERFRTALKDEAQRFEFREQLQGQLRSWRPRELWPFPGLPQKAVDAAVELEQLTRRDDGPRGRGRQPRIKEMDAAARKLQSLFRWRKLWTQLDTAQEREAAAKKIQAMHRGNQVRRGLAAQFAAVHHVEVLPPSNPPAAEVLTSRSEGPIQDPAPQHLAPDFGRTTLPSPSPSSPGGSAQGSPRSSVDGKVHLHVASSVVATPPPSSALMGFFDAPDAEVEAAAVRIQAMERGRQERKKLKALKAEKVELVEEDAAANAPAPTASLFSLGPMEVEEVAASPVVEEMMLDPMSFVGSTQGPTEPLEVEEEERREGLELASPEVEDAEVTLLTPAENEQPALDPLEVHVAQQPEEALASAVPEVSAATVFDPVPSVGLEISKAPVKHSKGFRMAPVNFGSEEPARETKTDSPRSPGWQGSNHSDGLPDNTLDFIDDTPSSQLVPQSQLRLKLPKAKKSPRAKVDRVEPLIKPTLAASSTAAVKPEQSAAWLAGPELQGGGAAASSDLLGPSPGPGASLVSGFRLPKGDRAKEERDESKGKKKKKKKKEKKEDDLDNFGFDIF